MRAIRGAAAAVLLAASFVRVADARPAHDVTSVTFPNLVVTESQGAVEIGIHRGEHGFQDASVDYSTQAGSAQAATDFDLMSGTLTLAAPSDDKVVFVPIVDDAVDEPVESFTFALDRAGGGTILRYPTSAMVTIIDDDGAARISFAAADLSNYENRGAVRVTLVRSGDATAEASVNVAVADGTAATATDYTPPTTTTITWAAGSRTRSVDVTLLNDSNPEQSETFSLSLADPSGAALAEPQTATVTILDDDSGSSDSTAPVSQFHRPRNGRSYKPKELRSLHIITSDDASGVATLDGALRRKLRNGHCSWLTKSGFKPGSCSTRKWVDLQVRNFVYWRLGVTLKPSKGPTRIKNYTAYARSTDAAGNVETKFTKGRNQNSFEVK